ncbi:hypothetical protein ANPL_04650 [Anaplasma platys]|uniref:Uncharacterized protein n=1 Tax=Anaplasma platys TaxID=949 RepID=A0A858PZC2_9RICK|nr:hypothetical protein ANPL_04650 [Anaplasma platys]
MSVRGFGNEINPSLNNVVDTCQSILIAASKGTYEQGHLPSFPHASYCPTLVFQVFSIAALVACGCRKITVGTFGNPVATYVMATHTYIYAYIAHMHPSLAISTHNSNVYFGTKTACKREKHQKLVTS